MAQWAAVEGAVGTYTRSSPLSTWTQAREGISCLLFSATLAIIVGCLPSFAIFIRGRVTASRAHNQDSSNLNSTDYYPRMRSRGMPGGVRLEEDNHAWQGEDTASDKSLVADDVTVAQTWSQGLRGSAGPKAKRTRGTEAEHELETIVRLA